MSKTIKLNFIDKKSEGNSQAQVEAFEKLFILTDENPDVIYCGTIARMDVALRTFEQTKKPLVVYCWDYYLWAHGTYNHSGDWNRYADMLSKASLIFVPSTSQQLRLKELLGLDSVVVHSGVTTYDHEVTDGGFILDPVRYYPEKNKTWAEEAAKLLNIPIVHSEHQYSYEEFKKLVASCSFITSCYIEASTGGLPLIEGLYLGKPSLISDSPYMGGRDYLGEYSNTFKHDDFNDLVDKMRSMWNNRPQIDVTQARKYISENFTYDLMAQKIYNKICELLNN